MGVKTGVFSGFWGFFGFPLGKIEDLGQKVGFWVKKADGDTCFCKNRVFPLEKIEGFLLLFDFFKIPTSVWGRWGRPFGARSFA